MPLHAHIGNEKKGFIKNKVMEAIITRSVEKVALIPFTHVYQLMLESDGAWGIWSQRLPNVSYMVKFPFIEIFCCTCEWAMQGNMCKHQIVVIFTCVHLSGGYHSLLWNMVWITS
jgi:hypothetical protein